MRVPASQIREQLVSVLRAWGMSDAHAATTADMMLETDLRGVDSHGISMLPTYDKEFRAGRLNMRPTFKTGRGLLVEAYLLDFDGDVYGQELRLDFLERLRGERRFESVEELVEQMGRDVEETRKIV